MFATPRIKIKNLQDFVSTKMGCWRVPLKCQKFLHPSPQKFRQHLRKLDFFSKKNTIFADFEGQFFLWWGCAWSEIFFWGDRHRLGVKPHGRPKSRTGPPQPSVSRFWFPRIEKSHFFIFFNENFSFFRFFHRQPGGSPDARNFFQQQVEQNRPIWGAHQKIGNIWPPKSSIPKSSFVNYFQNFQN